MKQITTKSGLTVSVNENAADDMAYLDLICAMADGDPRALRGIISFLLSKEDEAQLYAHVRTEDGRTPISAVNAEMMEIMQALGKK